MNKIMQEEKLTRLNVVIKPPAEVAEAEKVANEISWKIKNSKADTIAVYKIGEHGTCIELVNKFKLL